MRTTAEPGSIDHEYNRRSYHLKRLGFLKPGASVEEAYDAYCERSPEWRRAKDRYEASGRPKHCFVCRKGNYQLHHTTYARLGFEEPEDLVALCDAHHRIVQRDINNYRYSFATAHRRARVRCWNAWLRRLVPEIRDRFEAAQASGVVAIGGPIRGIRTHLEDDDWSNVWFRISTTEGEVGVKATFPDGIGTSSFELRTVS